MIRSWTKSRLYCALIFIFSSWVNRIKWKKKYPQLLVSQLEKNDENVNDFSRENPTRSGMSAQNRMDLKYIKKVDLFYFWICHRKNISYLWIEIRTICKQITQFDHLRPVDLDLRWEYGLSIELVPALLLSLFFPLLLALCIMTKEPAQLTPLKLKKKHFFCYWKKIEMICLYLWN